MEERIAMQDRIGASRKVGLPAKIIVAGVGGGGCNTVRRLMSHERIPGVECVMVNTDIKSLDSNTTQALSLQIGEHLTHGFGAGGDARVGARAAEEGHFLLKRAVKDAELVFITAGMGGGTGTGAAPIVARIARESGALALAVVTTPFSFEGSKRYETAMDGVSRLQAFVDNIIVIHNDRLLQYTEHNTPVGTAFAMADEVLSEGILSVSQLINLPGEINVDLADVKVIMRIKGQALMVTGYGEGQNPAIDAAEQALSNPLLNVNMKGAKGVLINFSGGPDLTIGEVNEAATYIARQADPRATIFFGMSAPDERLQGKVKVNLISTGIRMQNPSGSGMLSGLGKNIRGEISKRWGGQ